MLEHVVAAAPETAVTACVSLSEAKGVSWV
jgi:hypothetical protein